MPRRYGQHFLTDAKVVRRVVEASGAGKDDAVLEIGPGRGVLTRALAERAGRVLAVEIDRRLASELDASGLPPNVEVRLGDILRTDLKDVERALGTDYHVVANLPYEVTTEVLRKLLASPHGPASATVMVQKEVGERVVEKDGRASRLSLFCGYFSEPELLFLVPSGAFSPPPRVDSCVVRFVRRPRRLLPPDEEGRFFALTEAAFAAKRKKVGNSLRTMLGEDAEKALAGAGINPDARPEQIHLNAWLSLARRK